MTTLPLQQQHPDLIRQRQCEGVGMHRQTPLTAGYVGYTGGGVRSLVDEVNDGPMMQEMKGSFMHGESRQKIESPQNYGFTSVVMPATKGKDGSIEECAEAYINFLGGSRSFPVAAVMDDRRYRLKGLKPGDVAMFDHLQHQVHFNGDGMFLTGRTDKKLKFGLVAPPQESSSGAAAGQHDAGSAPGGASNGSSSSSGSNRKKGQKQRYDQESKQFTEITKDATTHAHDKAITHKTAQHSFASPDGAATQAATQAAGGPLMQIFGDKFTAGLGHFMKQVTAAAPTSASHLATKGYIDSIIAGLGFNMPTLPNFPMPGLPPGITLPPGVTMPPGLPLPVAGQQAAAVEPTVQRFKEDRLEMLERRIAELESRLANA